MKIRRIFAAAVMTALSAAPAHAFSNAMFGAQMKTSKEIMAMSMEFFVKYSWSIVGSIVIMIVGYLVAKFLGAALKAFLLRRHADVTITKFLVDIFKLCILATAALICLGNFGITIAPFIAGLSVVGFGTSFALQGPLSNYAAGATLVFTKPFKVGDILEFGEWMGQVEDMTLARTIIKTIDGTRVVIPNKKIIGEVIHNYSDHKKLDIRVGVGYGTDVKRAVAVVKDVIAKDKRIAAKPAPKVGIAEFAASSIVIYARVWCKQLDYWDLMFNVNEAIYDEFSKSSITIPFPQQDVHLYTEKERS